jgi:hypothetical protein
MDGKFSRQLRSAWTDAWVGPNAPVPLPMPFQSIIVQPTMQRINKLAEGGHDGATQIASCFVGQGVGLMNETVSARDVVRQNILRPQIACAALSKAISLAQAGLSAAKTTSTCLLPIE